MSIDVSTLIFTAIFTVAIFGPIVYLIWKGKNRLHQSIKVIRKVEKDQSLSFEHFESWSDKAIGLDPKSKKLIYVDMLSQVNTWKLIDLKIAGSSKVINTGDVIQLLITHRNHKDMGIEVLDFFNTQNDDPLEKGFHTILANKWSQLIQKHILKTDKSPRRAA